MQSYLFALELNLSLSLSAVTANYTVIGDRYSQLVPVFLACLVHLSLHGGLVVQEDLEDPGLHVCQNLLSGHCVLNRPSLLAVSEEQEMDRNKR